jgi:hypothetical protein
MHIHISKKQAVRYLLVVSGLLGSLFAVHLYFLLTTQPMTFKESQSFQERVQNRVLSRKVYFSARGSFGQIGDPVENVVHRPERRVKIAVLDSGITDDGHFRVADGKNFTTPDIHDIRDFHGHGTQMASIIAGDYPEYSGLNPKAELIIAKVADGLGSVNVDEFNDGLAWVIDRNVDIINISLTFNNQNKRTQRLLNVARKKGILIIGAVGNPVNQNDTQQKFPASEGSVISVGPIIDGGMFRPAVALSQTDKRLNPDVFMPGMVTAKNQRGQTVTTIGSSSAAAYATGWLSKLYVGHSKKEAIEVLRENFEQ